MCGIVGVAGHITQKEEKAFKQMLILDSLRGIDSTGVAAVCGDDVDIIKSVGDPFILMEMNKFTKAFQRNNRVLIGHNRYATQGKVTRNTAHPFEYGNLVGVHNGTLTNKWELTDGNTFDVDSQALYNDMSINGPMDTIAKAEGAWSLTWWNKTNKTLNFLRNSERPMHIAVSKGGTIFFASELWMVEVACSRNDIELTEKFSTKSDKLYVYGFDGPTNIKQVFTEEGLAGKKKSYTVVTPITPTSQVGKGGIRNELALKEPRDVEFTALSLEKDDKGALYVNCRVAGHITQYRWFLNKTDRGGQQYVGKEFTGQINKFVTSKENYFKIDYGSVKMKRASLSLVTDVLETSYLSGSGRYLPLKSWLAAHGECSWCSGAIDPKSRHHFVNGDILCGACYNDPALADLRG